jgi:hypothetical protein
LNGASLFIYTFDDSTEVAGSDLSDALVYHFHHFAVAGDLCATGASEQNYDAAYGGGATLEGVILDVSDGAIADSTWYHIEVATSNIDATGSTSYSIVCQADVDNDSSLSSVGYMAFNQGWPHKCHLQLDVPGGFAWIF